MTKPYSTKTTEYKAWGSILARLRRKAKASQTPLEALLDPRWLEYPNFLSDMGERPAGKNLITLNVKLPASKENCAWSDLATGRAFRPLEDDTGMRVGVYKCDELKPWAARFGVRRDQLPLGRYETYAEACAARRGAEILREYYEKVLAAQQAETLVKAHYGSQT
jgi:hypothetical protein